MNKDFRVSTGFPTHPKKRKLRARLGDGGITSLIELWAFTASNKPTGRLDGMSNEDIEIAADWRGKPGQFTRALLDLRLLDKDGDTFLVHHWKKHNGYAFHAPERSEHARQAAASRWSRNKNEDAQSGSKQCSEHEPALPTHANGSAPDPAPDPAPVPDPGPSPSPEPEPNPNPKDLTHASTSGEVEPRALSQRLVDLWNSVTNRLPKVRNLTRERIARSNARLREYSVQDLEGVFKRLDDSEFANGHGSNGWRATFDWITCSKTNVQKVLEGNYDNRKVLKLSASTAHDLERLKRADERDRQSEHQVESVEAIFRKVGERQTLH